MMRLVMITAAVLAAAAAGQQTEYRLNQGNWEKVSEPPPGTNAAFIADARRLIADEKYGEARRVLTRWIDQNKFTDNEYLAEAYVLRGDARQGQGDEYLALYDYKKVMIEFPQTAVFLTACQRSLDIAVKYVNGMKRKFLGIRWYGAAEEGEEMLVRVGQATHLSVLDERAEMELIRYYFRTRDLKWCDDACYVFLKNFPRSAYRPKVMAYRIYSNVGLFAGPEYDGGVLVEARELIRQYMMEFPAQAEQTGLGEAMLARLDEHAARQMFTAAQWYLKRGKAAAAKFEFQRVVRDHSLTVAAAEAYDVLEREGWTQGITPPGPETILPGPEGVEAPDPEKASEGGTP